LFLLKPKDGQVVRECKRILDIIGSVRQPDACVRLLVRLSRLPPPGGDLV
jgi:hypothetical protein